MPAAVRVSKVDFDEAVDSSTGWCTACKAFTTGCCEPDATDYECERCGEPTAYGAEEALLQGLIEVDDSPSLSDWR